MAIKNSNTDVGGRLLEMGEMEFMVRGLGYIKGIDDLKKIPIGFAKSSGTPIYLENVANIDISAEIAGSIQARIDADLGQTEMCQYVVPAGYTAYLVYLDSKCSLSDDVVVRFQRAKENNAYITK